MSFNKEVAVGVSVDDSATKQRPFPIGRDVDAIQVLIHTRVQYLVLGLITIRIRMKGGAGQKYLDLEDAQILEVDTKILFLLSDRLFA